MAFEANQSVIVLPGRKPKQYNPTVRERIDDLIHAELGGSIEVLLLGTRLVEELGADSLEMVELAISLEEEFEIPEIDDRVAGKWVCVQDVYKHVEKALKGKK